MSFDDLVNKLVGKSAPDEVVIRRAKKEVEAAFKRMEDAFSGKTLTPGQSEILGQAVKAAFTENNRSAVVEIHLAEAPVISREDDPRTLVGETSIGLPQAGKGYLVTVILEADESLTVYYHSHYN